MTWSGQFLASGCQDPPKGCKRWPGGKQLPSAQPLCSYSWASHTPAFSTTPVFSTTRVSAANWLEPFSNSFISPDFGNSENLSYYPLLTSGLHLSRCFPSQVILLSDHSEPTVSSECWPWLFLPQHLGASAPQRFSPKREKQTEAGRYSLVDFSYT